MDAQQTELVQAVLVIAALILTGAGVAYLFKLWEVKQVQLSQGKWTLFNWIVSQAVIGTEQLWHAKLIDKDGRLKNAVDIVRREVDAWGLRGFDVKRITDAVTAAIGHDLNEAVLVAQSVPKPSLPELPDLPTGPQN